MIVVRWALYVVHSLVYWLYNSVQFISKPGTRFVVPVIVMVASAFYLRPAIHQHFGLPLSFDNLFAVLVDAVTFVVLVVICWVYVYLSRSIGLVLGIFPPIARPLQPLGRLRATSDTVRPVVVRLAVPPLPGSTVTSARPSIASVTAKPKIEKSLPQPKRRRGPFVRWVVFPALGLTAVAAALVAGIVAYSFIDQAIFDRRQKAEEAAARQKIFDQQSIHAQTMVANGITLNDERLSCELSNGGTLASPNPDVVANIVAIAQAKSAVFFIHGLNWQSKDGWATMAETKTLFADAAAAVSSNASGPIALCYVRWPSLLGYGTNTDYVEKAMLSLAVLWNYEADVDDYHSPRHLMVVGYSAGGNLAAQSVVDLYRDEEKSSIKHPFVTLVTIVTPHTGADAVNLYSSPAGVIGNIANHVFNALGIKEDGTDGASRINEGIHSAGIQQISPDNQDLISLKATLKFLHRYNRDFAIVNIYSSRDDVVPVNSSSLDFADQNIDLADTGMTHVDFMKAPAGGHLRGVLAAALTLELGAASASDPAAPDPAPSAPTAERTPDASNPAAPAPADAGAAPPADPRNAEPLTPTKEP